MATAPRFEIEIGAKNTDLINKLNESKRSLQDFQRQVTSIPANAFDPLVRSLNSMRQPLRDLISLSRQLGANINNSTNQAGFNSALQQSRLDAAQYRAEIARLNRDLAQLRLTQAQNRQGGQAAAGSYREAQQRLTALGQAIRNAAGGFNNMTPAVRAQIAQYRQLNDQLKAYDRLMGNNQRNVGNYPMAFNALGSVSPMLSTLASSGGAYIAAGLAIKNAYETVSQFDSGLKNVQKTTGLTSAETAQLGKEFVALSRSLKTVSSQSLTEYATVAGQLGVKGTPNILKFSEALAKLETASDIKGEQGGSEIARLLTLTDGGVQNVKTFADEIVNLGNNFAATESEILGNATRIAQSTGVYKLGRESVLAYATATKSVGVEAELVGSTIGRALGTIEGLSRSTKGAEQLTKLLGYSQAELQKRFKENSAGVLTDFIGALNKIDKSGGSVNATLEKLGINAIRDKSVLGSLATNGFDVLTNAIDKTRDSAGSLDQEFETASGKIQNQVGRIKIAWENLVLSIENGTGAIGNVATGFADASATIIDGFTNIVTSTSWREFFLRFGELSGFKNIQLAAGIAGNIARYEEANPNRPTITPLQRSVSKATKGFNNLTEEQKLLKIRETTASVQARAAEYNARKDSENLSRLTYQNALLAEMNKLYYSQAKAKTTAANAGLITDDESSKGTKKAANDLKAAQDAVAQIDAKRTRGLEGELAKIDSRYVQAYDKVNKLANGPEKERLKTILDQTKALEKQLFIYENPDFSIEIKKGLGSGITSIPNASSITTPTALTGKLNLGKLNAVGLEDDVSKYIKNAMRRSVANTIESIYSDLTNLGTANYEIEQKYAKLRSEASADQIAALQKMERLEKSINNGFTNLLTNAINSLTSIGTKTLSTAVGEGFSTGDFSQLKGLFSGDKKAVGYGMAASALGGIISGNIKNTFGEVSGGVLSGAGTGAAIGTAVGGPVGTIVGAIGGGIIGAISGIFGSSKRKKEEELQRLQLEEQKKQTALQERANALAYASSIIGQLSNQGIVSGIDRDAFGNLVANIKGSDIQLVLDRAKNERG